jgi:hypothetical protein
VDADRRLSGIGVDADRRPNGIGADADRRPSGIGVDADRRPRGIRRRGAGSRVPRDGAGAAAAVPRPKLRALSNGRTTPVVDLNGRLVGLRTLVVRAA